MYPIITTVTLITKSWSRRRLLAPVGPAPVQAGIDSVLFITQWRQRSPVLRRAAPDEVELPSRVTGYTATADATKHVGYQHNNESSVGYRDSTCFLQPGSVARLRDTGLPTRTRSRWHRRSGRRWHTRTVARRLRDPQLAGRLRHLSGCRRGRTWYCFASLNGPEDDPHRRDRTGSRARHRRLRREDAGRRRPAPLIQCWLHIFVDLAAFGSDVQEYCGDRSTPRRIADSELSPIPARLGTNLGTKRGATAEMAWNMT